MTSSDLLRLKENLCELRNNLFIAKSVMARDIRNVNRGCCQSCKSCSNFISVSGRVLCDYCGCPPAQHQQLPEEKLKRSASNDDDDRTSSPDDLRSSLGGNDRVVVAVHSFRSDSDLLKDSCDYLDEDLRGRKAQKSRG